MQPQQPNDPFLVTLRAYGHSVDRYLKIAYLCKKPLVLDASIFRVVTNPLTDETIFEEFKILTVLTDARISIEPKLVTQIQKEDIKEFLSKYKKTDPKYIRVADISEEGDPGGCYNLVKEPTLNVLFHCKEEQDTLLSLLLASDEISIHLLSHTKRATIDISKYVLIVKKKTKDIRQYLEALIHMWYTLAILVIPSFQSACSISLKDIKKRLKLVKVKGINSDIMNLFYYLIYGIRLVDSYIGLFEDFAPQPEEDTGKKSGKKLNEQESEDE